MRSQLVLKAVDFIDREEGLDEIRTPVDKVFAGVRGPLRKSFQQDDVFCHESSKTGYKVERERCIPCKF